MNKLEEFFTYLEIEKRYSLNTIKSYRRDLFDFLNFISNEQIESIDSFCIKNYLASLYIKNASKSTISRRISSIKSYYNFLIKKYKENHQFINTIKAPKKDKLLPDLVYKDELEKVLNYNFNGDFCYRNKAIVCLLYSSGIRVSELCNININSIDIDNRFIVVKGKGNKTRITPFSVSCKDIIENYICIERNKHACTDCNYLFINKYGNKISSRSIQNIISSLSIKIFGNKKLHPHIFRHTFATKLINHGADLRTVQELLGHSSLITTQIYTHLANNEIIDIYKISHPRSETD